MRRTAPESVDLSDPITIALASALLAVAAYTNIPANEPTFDDRLRSVVALFLDHLHDGGATVVVREVLPERAR